MNVIEQKPRYELHHDRIEETYTIRKVQDIGPFESREAAREWMLALPADPRGAVVERDRLRDVLRAVLIEPDPIKRNQLAAPVLTTTGGQ